MSALAKFKEFLEKQGKGLHNHTELGINPQHPDLGIKMPYHPVALKNHRGFFAKRGQNINDFPKRFGAAPVMEKPVEKPWQVPARVTPEPKEENQVPVAPKIENQNKKIQDLGDELVDRFVEKNIKPELFAWAINTEELKPWFTKYLLGDIGELELWRRITDLSPKAFPGVWLTVFNSLRVFKVHNANLIEKIKEEKRQPEKPEVDEEKERKKKDKEQQINKIDEDIKLLNADIENYEKLWNELQALRLKSIVNNRQSLLNVVREQRNKYAQKREEAKNKRGEKERLKRQLEAEVEDFDEFEPLIRHELPIEKEISDAEVIDERKNEHAGINKSFWLKLKNGTVVLWKPSSNQRKKFKNNDYKNEIAAYELAKIIGLEKYVPITVEKKYKGQYGSVQVKIDNTEIPNNNLIENKLNDVNSDIYDMFMFDAIINNADRHTGNFLIQNGEDIRFIDHGFGFHSRYDLRFDAFRFNVEASRATLLDKHRKMLDTIERQHDRIRDRLLPLIGRERTEALFQRANFIKNIGNYREIYNRRLEMPK